MHRGHPEPGICAERGELSKAAFPSTEVGEHPQVSRGARYRTVGADPLDDEDRAIRTCRFRATPQDGL